MSNTPVLNWKKEWWNWNKVREHIRSLKGRLGFENNIEISFLGFKLNTENGEVYDEILNRVLKEEESFEIYYLLYMYSKTIEEVEETGEYKTLTELFKLTGDLAKTHYPEFRITCKKLEEIFGRKPELLHQAAKIFKHRILNYGDISIKIYALPKIPIIIIIWKGNEELPPSSNIMFEKSIINYLNFDCEAMVRLTRITIERLITNLTKSCFNQHKP